MERPSAVTSTLNHVSTSGEGRTWAEREWIRGRPGNDGQFAGHVRDESTVALVNPPIQPSTPQDRFAGDILNRRIDWANSADVQKVYRIANRMAAKCTVCSRGPLKAEVDAESVASEAVYALWKKQGETADDDFADQRWRGYLKNAIARRVTGLAWPARAEDRKAYLQYQERCAEAAAAGRRLTDEDRDAIALEVFESFPARRRPVIGFQHGHHYVAISKASVDDPDKHLGTELSRFNSLDTDRMLEAEDDVTDPDTWVGVARLINDGAIEPAPGHTLEMDRWLLTASVVCSAGGAPQPREGVLSSEQWQQATTDVGDVVTAAQSWLDGESDGRSTALFAPFGRLADDGRDRVAQLFVDRSTHARAIWDSAALFARRDSREMLSELRRRAACAGKDATDARNARIDQARRESEQRRERWHRAADQRDVEERAPMYRDGAAGAVAS